MNKNALSERDICTKFITPAIAGAGWDTQTQLREEVSFTKGRIHVRGQLAARGEAKRADYILYLKPNIPLAVVEAKDGKHFVGDGMQQALDYARTLDLPFAYSSNGDGFVEHDLTQTDGVLEREIALNEFPSPDELWNRYCAWKGWDEMTRQVIAQDYYDDGSGKTSRYYQNIAINRTTEAVATGQNRLLLVMATGTGKTFTAFQIIWRLWKSKQKKRILFLADRNILVDQTRTNDFKPFGAAMTKITNRQIDKSYEIYLALYQAVTGTEDAQNIYRQFSRDFFDLIVVDECHRGSAAEDSAWREILEYFSAATQIGLTATPRETKEVSNSAYFGEPIYTYSLKQGIEDGFLAPYKVVRVDLDRDMSGWRPESGKKDRYGHEIEDRIYNARDFDRNLVLEQRTLVVARKVSEFLKQTDRFAKSIIFCEDINHAERMRQALVNENADEYAKDGRYVMRITGDNPEGKAELDNFILLESRYPVLVTTSRLMTTGVDAQTCKLIVLDRRVESIAEFKQIIGRGTRVNEEHGKWFFTIMDFKQATNRFADRDFDGDPVQIYVAGENDPIVPPDDLGDDNRVLEVETPDITWDIDDKGRPRKYFVGDVEVRVAAERVQYYGSDGKLITESLRDYTRKAARQEFGSLDEFLRRWSQANRKDAMMVEMQQHGLLLDALASEVGVDYDAFDLVCHVAFDRPALTRRERALNVKKRDVFARYGKDAKRVLDALLDKYADAGIENIEDMGVLKLLNLGTPMEIVKHFGGRDGYFAALRELENEIYRDDENQESEPQAA